MAEIVHAVNFVPLPHEAVHVLHAALLASFWKVLPALHLSH